MQSPLSLGLDVEAGLVERNGPGAPALCSVRAIAIVVGAAAF